MKPKVLIKVEEDTDPRYGSDPNNRPIREHIRKGIINLDKPSGPTSHQVSAWVRDILEVKKAGHSGTLDPKVSGVLPIAVEDATRILPLLLISGKQYVVLLNIHGEVSDSRLKQAIGCFQGEIYQKPPLKSSVKRQIRTKKIYSIKLLERENKLALLQVDCESGTYMRKLCHDIGLVLGTGANMQDLRRTRVGSFTEEYSTILHDIKDAYVFYREEGEERYIRECVKPVEYAVKDLPKVWVRDSAVSAVCHGADLNIPGISKLDSNIKKGDVIALLTLKNELIAIAKSEQTSDEVMNAKKGVAAKLMRVIMEPDVYPRKWRTHQNI